MHKPRKYTCLYCESFKAAIQGDMPILNSENLEEYTKFFVDNNISESIFNSIHQLICGRRGTGKTHALGAFEESINRNPRNHAVAIRVSLGTIHIESPSEYKRENRSYFSEKHASDIFNGFLFLFIDNLSLILQEKYLDNPAIPLRTRNAVVLKILKLMDTVKEGVLIKKNTSYEYTNDEGADTKEKKDWSIKADLKAKFVDSSLSFSTGEEEEQSVSKKKSKKESFDAIRVLNITLIRSLIRDIIRLLKLHYIYVLIDEFMQIDKTARLNVQPYFAELLKRTFLMDRNICVKIATVWHETELYDRDDLKTSRGIQIGEDIQLGTDLDAIFMSDWQFVSTFFKNLLYKRLRDKADRLEDFLINGEVDDMFVTELFDNSDNFREMILASHGIPREFIKIFHNCAKLIRCDFKKHAINKELIRSVAKCIFLTEKRKKIEKSESIPAYRLFEDINRYINDTKKRYFFVDNDDAKTSLNLRKLADEKIIHPIPSALVPKQVRDNYKCFFVDYGNYIDWYDSIKCQDQSLLAPILAPVHSDKFSEFVLDIKEFEKDFISCQHCNKQFSRLEKCFIMRKLCPSCYLENSDVPTE